MFVGFGKIPSSSPLNLETFRSLLLLQIQPVDEEPNEARCECHRSNCLLHIGSKTWKNSELSPYLWITKPWFVPLRHSALFSLKTLIVDPEVIFTRLRRGHRHITHSFIVIPNTPSPWLPILSQRKSHGQIHFLLPPSPPLRTSLHLSRQHSKITSTLCPFP